MALRLDVQGPHPYQLVYHEYVHLLNSLNLRRLPLWLNEGLAEVYGSAEIDDEEVRWGQPFPWHVQLLRAKKLLPMDEFLAGGFDSGYLNEADRVSVYYAQCWALTHMLIMGDEKRRTALADFLKNTTDGVPSRNPLSDAARATALGILTHQAVTSGATLTVPADPAYPQAPQ